MVQGWRPTSAVNQPVKIAMNGRGKLRNVAHSGGRFLSMRPLAVKYDAAQASTSMISQQPTMIRKAKNGMSTGGRSWGGKSVNPTSLEVKLMLAIRLPRTGIEIAYLLLSAAGSGIPNRTSAAGCSSCQRASIAANLAG